MIFGYKQTGPNAFESDNLFHPNSYENTINIDTITDPYQKRALKDQINEYGQTPKQIFFSPHPRRRSAGMILAELQFPQVERSSFEIPKISVPKQTENIESSEPQQAKPEPVNYKYHFELQSRLEVTRPSCLIQRQEGKEILVCEDKFLKTFTRNSVWPTKIFSVGSVTLSCVEQLNDDLYALGNTDGEIFLFDYSFGVVDSGTRAHFNTVTSFTHLPHLVK